jgi:hypothetical protein
MTEFAQQAGLFEGHALKGMPEIARGYTNSTTVIPSFATYPLAEPGCGRTDTVPLATLPKLGNPFYNIIQRFFQEAEPEVDCLASALLDEPFGRENRGGRT